MNGHLRAKGAAPVLDQNPIQFFTKFEFLQRLDQIGRRRVVHAQPAAVRVAQLGNVHLNECYCGAP